MLLVSQRGICPACATSGFSLTRSHLRFNKFVTDGKLITSCHIHDDGTGQTSSLNSRINIYHTPYPDIPHPCDRSGPRPLPRHPEHGLIPSHSGRANSLQ